MGLSMPYWRFEGVVTGSAWNGANALTRRIKLRSIRRMAAVLVDSVIKRAVSAFLCSASVICASKSALAMPC